MRCLSLPSPSLSVWHNVYTVLTSVRNTGWSRVVNVSELAETFSVINIRLYNLCEINNILKETQAGFRSECSTVDHIFVLNGIIDLFCFKARELYCSFVDYRKAFDTIWRHGLWLKLLKYGLNGKLYDVIKNMYKHIKSCVVVFMALNLNIS